VNQMEPFVENVLSHESLSLGCLKDVLRIRHFLVNRDHPDNFIRSTSSSV
jgi:hypothetical protein